MHKVLDEPVVYVAFGYLDENPSLPSGPRLLGAFTTQKKADAYCQARMQAEKIASKQGDLMALSRIRVVYTLLDQVWLEFPVDK